MTQNSITHGPPQSDPPPRHAAMKEAYGFGLFPLPGYRGVSRGDWRITVHTPGFAPGYLTRTAVEARAVLTKGREVWMCTGLLETESHAWHVDQARGVVVTAGVGMGLYTYAAAMREEVDLVIAADISPDILALAREATRFDDWPCKDKVRFLETDVLADDFADKVRAVTGGRPVDYLYADIWPNFPAAQAPKQTAEMARALSPKAAGWWGQELSFAQAIQGTDTPPDVAALTAYFAEEGVPAPTFTPGYAAFCRDVMAVHGMGGKTPVWRRFAGLFRRR